MNFSELIEEKKLIICCGSGGVGKTTTAAALAVKAAIQGKKVAVLTIDPARRLANSLGIESFSEHEKEIPRSAFEAQNISLRGQLFAFMLDIKSTFDRLIEKYSPSAETQQKILSNPLYQHLSTMIAGSQEYMAMEKIYEISQKKEYDLLILDTPPTRNALDFLEAPQKMSRAVNDSLVKWFVKPTGWVGSSALKWFEVGTKKIFKVLDQVLGADFLQDLSIFFISAAGLLKGFHERAEAVQTLLQSAQTTFVIVTTPQKQAIREALFFSQAIRHKKLPFSGFVLNRTYPLTSFQASEAELKTHLELAGLTAELTQNTFNFYRTYLQLAQAHQTQLDLLKTQLKKTEDIQVVPIFSNDVHDLKSLAKVASYLF